MFRAIFIHKSWSRVAATAALAAICSTYIAFAAPYPPEGLAVEWTQPDGTELNLRVFGDEFYARTETEDGRTVIFDKKANAYFYAKVSDDEQTLESTGARVGENPANSPLRNIAKAKSAGARLAKDKVRKIREANIQELVPDQREKWAERVAAKNRRDQAQSNPSSGPSSSQSPEAAAPAEETEFAVLGNKIGLTVLVQFPDDTETPASDPVSFPTTQAKVIRYCNEAGYTDDGNTGSVRDYFYDQSEGAVTYTQVVTTIITLPHARNYYNFEDYPTNQTIRSGGATGRLLVADAVAILQSQNFDFTSLSLNAANEIIATNLIWAGPTSGVWPSGLWPLRTSISRINVGTTQSPRYVHDFQMTNANSAAIKIGTFCHENGHLLLGLPDLYDYGGESSGAGGHALMASGNHRNGGRTPAPINAYFKDVSGWANITDLTSSGFLEATLPTTGNVAYRFLKPGTPSEYFIVENRGNGDKWANSVPDKGIMIWHIDEAVNGNGNEQMTPTQHYEVSVEQSDGDFDLENKNNNGDSTDLWDSANAPFEDASSPDAKWWNGNDSGIYIEVLDGPGANMRVQFGNQPPNTIIIGTPTSGDLLTNFGPHIIEWSATIPDNVRIELFKGGAFHSNIVSSTPNDGTYQWEPDDTIPEGNDYSIRISSVANQLIEIFSGQFEIEHVLFSDGFETGAFRSHWTLSGTNARRNVVSEENEPNTGTWHALLDASSNTSSRNEMTLTVDLEEGANIELEFYAKEFNDSPDGPPSIPFTTGANFDGVAISENGTSWYEVQALRSNFTTWQKFTVDLDAAIATHGLSYTRDFRIRFNHYGNASIPNDGFAFDDVKIFGDINRSTTLTLNPANDSGASNSDRITKNNQPFFTGATRENLNLTLISHRDNVLGTFSSGGTGNWSFRPTSPMSDGVHNLSISGDATTSSTLTVTIDTRGPAVTIDKAGTQADPTPAGPVRFTAVFDEPVSGFASGEVNVSGTVAGSVSLSGGPSSYTASVSTTGGDGNIIASVPGGIAVDIAGNTNSASTSSDNQVIVDGHGNGVGQATAFNLVAGGGGTSSANDTGWLFPGDTDSFSFTLVAPKTVEITTLGNIDTIGALYDSTGNLINNPSADDDGGAGLNFLITRVLPPGDYTVDLTSAGGGSDWEYDVYINLSDPPLLINEIDSLTFDDDEVEFIELFDGGRGNLSLDGKVLVFFEGASDTSYHAIDLDGLSTNADGYFVIGSDNLPQTDVTIADSNLNDGTAAVALYDADGSNFPNGTALTTNGLVDAIVYRPAGAPDDAGLASLLIPNDFQLQESANGFAVGQSLQRIPNGIGELRSGQQFQAVAPTPGAANDYPAAPQLIDLISADDLGISSTDNLTSVVQPEFTGIATPGAIINLISNHEGVIDTVHTARDGSFVVENHGVTFRGATHNVSAENASTPGTGTSLAVIIDNRAPRVTINQAAGQNDPVTSGPILFEAVFDEEAHGFAGDDIAFLSSLSGPVSISGGPLVYTVSVGTSTDEGFLELSLSQGAAFDRAGNPTQLATHTDNSVTLDVHGATADTGATTLNLEAGLGSISGWVQPGDTDSFIITLSDPRKFVVSTSGGIDTYGRIMDLDGNVLNVPHLDDDVGNGDNFLSRLTLEAGQYWVEVTGRGQSTGQYTLEIDATEPPHVQPDLAVGLSATNTKGDDLYDLPTAQSLSLHSYYGGVQKGTVTIENDGEVTDDFIVSASPGDSVFDVQYTTWLDGNITAELITGNYRVENLPPGEKAPPIVTVVTPNYAAVRQVVSRKVKGKKKKKKNGKKKKRKVKVISTVHWIQFAKTLTFNAKSAIVEEQSDTVQISIGTN